MSEQMRQYWQERFKQMEEAQHDTSVQKVQEIQEQFEKAQAAIEGKIDAWYQRLAQNNGVSMLEAKKMLTNKEQILNMPKKTRKMVIGKKNLRMHPREHISADWKPCNLRHSRN